MKEVATYAHQENYHEPEREVMDTGIKSPIIYVVANMADRYLSGGDVIAIECIKRWAKAGHKVTVFVSKSGLIVYNRCLQENVNFVVTSQLTFERNSLRNILLFEFSALAYGLMATLRLFRANNLMIYSASNLWPDSLPAWLMKLRNRGSKWIAPFYLFAPRAFSKESPYRGKKSLRGLLYFLSELPLFTIIRKYADMVWVTNESDRYRLIDGKRLTPDNVICIPWGVDTRTPLLIPETKDKKFDAVFIGRLHPQKGVLELISIWRYVCQHKKDAKLAIIGDGELEREIRDKIRRCNLESNITLLGYRDGMEKFKIFKESRIVVHPAIYETGAIAPAEAMACGLPGISFDLPAFRTYYPKGIIKIPKFDLEKFAKSVIELLTDEKLYNNLRKEAIELTKEMDWDKKAEELLLMMKNLPS